jgi:hypothetical protein
MELHCRHTAVVYDLSLLGRMCFIEHVWTHAALLLRGSNDQT